MPHFSAIDLQEDVRSCCQKQGESPGPESPGAQVTSPTTFIAGLNLFNPAPLPSEFHRRAEYLQFIFLPGPQLILKFTSVSSPAEITTVRGLGTVTQFEPEIPANSTSYVPTGTLSN